MPGAGAMEPCLAVPIFLNIIPRRDEGWDTVFNDLQPPAFTSHSSLCNVCVWLGENNTKVLKLKSTQTCDVVDDLNCQLSLFVTQFTNIMIRT